MAKSWGLSFIVPGTIMTGFTIFTILFLVPNPADIGLDLEQQSVCVYSVQARGY